MAASAPYANDFSPVTNTKLSKRKHLEYHAHLPTKDTTHLSGSSSESAHSELSEQSQSPTSLIPHEELLCFPNGAVENQPSSLDMHLKFCPTIVPPKPIRLTYFEDKTLAERLYNSLNNLDVKKLKSIYLSIVEKDPDLTGLITFEDLASTFFDSKIHITMWDLRLLSAVHISKDKEYYINYERLLISLEKILKVSTNNLF